LSASLRTIQKAFASGVSSSSDLEALGRRAIALQCEIHYLAIIDPTSLDQTAVATNDSIALVAASVDGVRLIDNCRLGGDE
jgi:pantothenate synthetase